MTLILKTIVNELQNINTNIRSLTTSQGAHLTVEEVARSMNCHVNTVRSWITEGELKTFQYKGTMRIRAESLERFIKRHTG